MSLKFEPSRNAKHDTFLYLIDEREYMRLITMVMYEYASCLLHLLYFCFVSLSSKACNCDWFYHSGRWLEYHIVYVWILWNSTCL